VKGVPPLDLFLKVAKEIASGLDSIHQLGLVHKDVKLSNILLPRDGSEATLSDLGMASALKGQTELAQEQALFVEGTPLYMAPEVMEGLEPDVRSDIYSYGAAMFHFLAGSPPFVFESSEENAKEKRYFLPKMARLLRPGVPEELDKLLCEQCMAKRPDARPRSMREIIERLDEIEIKLKDEGKGKQGRAVLFVDDDPNILESLKLLLRKEPYDVLCAGSGAEALKIMASRKIQLLVTDWRMPGMDGIALVKRVREKWPETLSIIFSGQADMDAVMAAINAGQVYKFLLKGWLRDELRQNIRLALDQYALKERNLELDKLLAERNKSLFEVNAELERKVEARTSEVCDARARLESQLSGMVETMFGIMEMLSEDLAMHCRIAGSVSGELARLCKLPPELVSDIETAGYLHDIGKIPLYYEMKGYLSKEEKERLLLEHPLLGARTLDKVKGFERMAEILRSHHESFDGQGYPDKLAGEAIPIGARIVAVADAFEHLVRPEGMSVLRESKFVRDAISRLSGKRLDPSLLEVFLNDFERFYTMIEQ